MNLQTKSGTGFFDGPVVTVESVGEEEAAAMLVDRRAILTMQQPSPVETPVETPEGDRS